MPRENRLYAKFTLDYPEHPKIAALSDSAFRTLTELVIYSRRVLADGRVPERVALRYWPAKALAELCENHDEKPSLSLVDGHYVVHDYGEHQTLKADIEKKREAGAKGGNTKAANRRVAGDSGGETGDKAPGTPVAPATNVQEQDGYENVAKTETETETETTTPEKPSAPSARERGEKLFEEAWASWPKRVDRKDALQKFHTALKQFRGREQELVDAIKAHGKAYAEHNEPKYRPGLAVWLNKERWNNPLPGTPEAGGDTTAPGGPGGPAAPRDPNAWMNPKRRTERPRPAGDDE